MGGKTSHTAIIARALQLPAVVACPRVTKRIRNGDLLIIDGTDGLVLVNPTSEEVHKYDVTKRHDASVERMLLKEIHLPTETQDNFRIHLVANMELTEEIDSIKGHGAEGIGLYRTEFLYLNRNRPPTEEEHFENYQKVLKSIYPHYATIRTLDIGADKVPTEHKYDHEINPALGLRAIRFCFKEKDLFRTQLRALYRASIYGKLKIMFPMISSVSELKQVRQMIDEVKRDLDKEKQEYEPHVKIGVMIEIPSAVMVAEELARKVDFFSIGTKSRSIYPLIDQSSSERGLSLQSSASRDPSDDEAGRRCGPSGTNRGRRVRGNGQRTSLHHDLTRPRPHRALHERRFHPPGEADHPIGLF